MRILHYSLGLPPYRSGGLTKYATDLMKIQQQLGHSVSLLWPGRMNLTKNVTRIRKPNFDNGRSSFEIVNPLPVSLLNGITDIDAYTAPGNIHVYKFFLVKYKFDVIHVHTLMGIHKEFFEAAKSLGIKIVYTTHDYFGICPKVSLFNRNGVCNDLTECTFCKECNKGALSLKKIKILQSPLYKFFKESSLVKSLRSNYKKNNTVNNTVIDADYESNHEEDMIAYRKLRSYYYEIFNQIDEFHFNSTKTKSVFEKYINIKKYQVIPISHNGISDNRKTKTFEGKLKITYLGAPEVYKGFDLIKKVLDDLYKNGNKDFELNIFSQTNKVSEYMNVHNGYKYSELGDIFDKTDLLVVPSVWNETFGFVALEGLSYGVPVMLTTNVGARDIIEGGKTAIVVEPDFADVKEKITEIYNDKNREILKAINKNIVNSNKNYFGFRDHVKEIVELYEGDGGK